MAVIVGVYGILNRHVDDVTARAIATFPDLSHADRRLLKAVSAGTGCRLVPGSALRGELVRWLYTDPVAKTLVERNGWPEYVTVWGDLDLHNIAIDFPLRLPSWDVKGEVNLQDARLCSVELCRTSCANLKADRAEISGDFLMKGAKVGQLVADRLDVGGDLVLSADTVIGQVGLPRAHIKGDLKLDGATLISQNTVALDADGLVVDGGLLITNTTVTGEARLPGAHIKGKLKLDGATLISQNTVALDADGLVVDGGLLISNTTVTGEARLPGAHIKGKLKLDGATLRNSGGEALVAIGLAVDGHLLINRTTVTGQVRLPGAHIKGDLKLDGATLNSPNKAALDADGLVVERSVFMINHTTVAGQVRLLDAHIQGQLELNQAHLINPNPDGPDGEALLADGLAVDGHLYMINDETTVTGQVRLRGAQIKGDLKLDGATLNSPNNPNPHKRRKAALDLERASVAQEVQMLPKDSIQGGINLTYARVGGWHDEERTWPRKGTLWLNGFVYQTISPVRPVKGRIEWLCRQHGRYKPQPYEQLAGVYRREGDEQTARGVAIAKQRARRDAVTGRRRRPSKVWSWFLRWTIGYGYKPARVLIWWAVLAVIGSWVFEIAYRDPSQLHPAKTGREQPSFNSILYTVDLLSPVVNLNVRSVFVAGGWAAWVAVVFIFAGWLLAAVVVAGLGGVFKRD